MKCCVYTRSFLESPYLDFFIEHYIKLGFDNIIILKSSDEDYECPSLYSSQVSIIKTPNMGNDLYRIHQDYVKKSDYDWILIVDVDEILLLNSKYQNIKQFIDEKVENDSNINVFFFRWGMIEMVDSEQVKTISEIIDKYNVFENTHIKSMIKKNNLRQMGNPHVPYMISPSVYFENNVTDKMIPVGHKINDFSYKDAILLHLHTRSINNLIIKSMNTKLRNKPIKNKEEFIKIINNVDNNKCPEDCFLAFKNNIGLKALLPFGHANSTSIILDKLINKFTIYDYKHTVIDYNKEKEITLKILKENNIDKDKYYQFINLVQQEIDKLGKFKRK